MNTDYVGGEKINRLPEHAGFCLDSADSPGNNPKAVDHSGMRIGPDKRIGVKQ